VYSAGHSEGYATGYDTGLNEGRTHGYNIWDPTYKEMENFIARDRTNENTYDINTYNCYDFTADVINNAEAENIRCAFVYILFPDGAHALVAFNTIDRGLIYIEPQNDDEISVSVGWSSYYGKTILNVAIIW